MAANEQDKIIKDAQFRKGAGIAFSNSTNSAISIVCSLPEIQTMTNEHILERVRFFREKFLDDYKQYYATVIANVGQNYKIEDSIAKLKSAKTLEELQTIWRLLSADERKDIEIKKVAQELNKEYKNEKA